VCNIRSGIKLDDNWAWNDTLLACILGPHG
jgi:hypothetical protein